MMRNECKMTSVTIYYLHRVSNESKRLIPRKQFSVLIPHDDFIQSDYTVTDLPCIADASNHTMTLSGDSGNVSYSCVKNTNKVIQLGRNSMNQICVPGNAFTATMPRFCMRICMQNSGELFVKAAGFDLTGDIFLPETKTVLGPYQYSTSNPLLMVLPVTSEIIEDIDKNLLYVSVNGDQYRMTENNVYEKLDVPNPSTGWYVCGHFLIHCALSESVV